ncbi:ABC-type multidrug transport system, ATPase component [Desulfitobacterium dichloroeliminans LMG P-21439]|uniref:ABC-type multidrug transport system, ATPase component n=1 Tax=Desulfitobacterium dichloroeliminans (strain LMG P-21439 / DCA1) TaxID=871963 RepID=L0F8G0_DESDL|nr:ABC transporter ATP-binding protein [Desulfitobacterium dichloroeliminans]AGA68941.1 ABC-type multidrug transport system, ATPase component [Desulfitobacterium dichloroeliminans LMG P-21439]
MCEAINTINLTKVYDNAHAVSNLNISVKKGEILGFLGLNGAGKTTTIRMLLGMVSPTSGQCYLQGKKVSARDASLWSEVGYIVETPYSYPELTVRENLEIVRGLRGVEDKTCVEWIINKLQLDGYASKTVKHLSLGNAQRLGIAKAIIHKPKILILDEPTNGLDPEGIIEVRDLLHDLAKNSGVTILVSSHKLDEIAKVATNIAIIHKGRLIKEVDGYGLARELKKSLILNGRDRPAMVSILLKAGYKVEMKDKNKSENSPVLCIEDEEVIGNPEQMVTLLVNKGYPPNLLKVEKEDLETYFIRVIKEAGGMIG